MPEYRVSIYVTLPGCTYKFEEHINSVIFCGFNCSMNKQWGRVMSQQKTKLDWSKNKWTNINHTSMDPPTRARPINQTNFLFHFFSAVDFQRNVVSATHATSHMVCISFSLVFVHSPVVSAIFVLFQTFLRREFEKRNSRPVHI